MNPEQGPLGPGAFAEQAPPDPEPEPEKTIFDLLFATDAGGRTTADIRAEYDLDSPGMALVLLGLLKMAGTGGFPAILDLAAGGYMALANSSAASSRSNNSDPKNSDELPMGPQADTDPFGEGEGMPE